MKKSIIKLFFIFFILISCNSIHVKDGFLYEENNSKEIWINSYKYEVFYECIKQGIGNDSLRIILKNKDLFNKSQELEFNTIDSARILGHKIIINLPEPYIKIDEGSINKNYISYNCLKYYASKELDEIAMIEYKKHFSKKRK
ncbi:MAG TPA: hypothetical protein P5335_11710 [Flavobacterium sp.]|jgi:hypothetical protein|nr:hypothetical protein [Flavobacterium sp.]HQV35275.1 hypothetical protein [Flavobacterium sp.]HQX02679.1 hypothetical protein [Flavobacterium sp.]HRZ33037.1 hypothetical protein [Flavobacterium sp.]HRZ75591.1 hypothetical protein [Flavobacterium sp.]